MQKYFWKYTTLKDCAKILLTEEDNENRPIALIVDKTEQPVAFLSSNLSENKEIEFIFSSKNEFKKFSDIKEAIKYSGLEENVDSENFLENLYLFSLYEKLNEDRKTKYISFNNPLYEEIKAFRAETNEKKSPILSETLHLRKKDVYVYPLKKDEKKQEKNTSDEQKNFSNNDISIGINGKIQNIGFGQASVQKEGSPMSSHYYSLYEAKPNDKNFIPEVFLFYLNHSSDNIKKEFKKIFGEKEEDQYDFSDVKICFGLLNCILKDNSTNNFFIEDEFTFSHTFDQTGKIVLKFIKTYSGFCQFVSGTYNSNIIKIPSDSYPKFPIPPGNIQIPINILKFLVENDFTKEKFRQQILDLKTTSHETLSSEEINSIENLEKNSSLSFDTGEDSFILYKDNKNNFNLYQKIDNAGEKYITPVAQNILDLNIIIKILKDRKSGKRNKDRENYLKNIKNIIINTLEKNNSNVLQNMDEFDYKKIQFYNEYDEKKEPTKSKRGSFWVLKNNPSNEIKIIRLNEFITKDGIDSIEKISTDKILSSEIKTQVLNLNTSFKNGLPGEGKLFEYIKSNVQPLENSQKNIKYNKESNLINYEEIIKNIIQENFNDTEYWEKY